MTTEVHGNFRPFFYPDATEAEQGKAGKMLVMGFATIEEQLGDKKFLVGEQMTIADAYLFVMLAWAAMMGIAVSERLGAYSARMKSVPSTSKALAEEGLA